MYVCSCFCFAFVFTLVCFVFALLLSHLNRCRGFVANIGGMGERKTSFSSMPPAAKQVWEPCPRAKLDVTFCAHVWFDLSFDLCFLFCLLQPKKKGPANPRSKATFNSDLSNWDVTSVADMAGMFRQANAFNCDLSIWDVSSVTNMDDMFLNAVSFNQKLCGANWFRSKANKEDMFELGSKFSNHRWSEGSTTKLFHI